MLKFISQIVYAKILIVQVQQQFYIKMTEQKQQFMTRINTDDQFTAIFNIAGNSSCFQCGKQAKQWVETRHAIFLCLTCATKFKDIQRFAYIKSVALQQWSEEELEKMRRGGNSKFKEFLGWYGLEDADPEVYLRSKAAEFYRIYLLNPEKLKLSDGPTIQSGKVIQNLQVPLSEMSSNELLQQAKLKVVKAGQTTLYYGNKVYDNIHYKITSGEYKEDVQKAADKVTETAKTIWSFVSNKLENIQKSAMQVNQA